MKLAQQRSDHTGAGPHVQPRGGYHNLWVMNRQRQGGYSQLMRIDSVCQQQEKS